MSTEMKKLANPFDVRLNTCPKNRRAVTARVIGVSPSDTNGVQEVHFAHPALIRDTQGVLMSFQFLYQVTRTGKLYAAGRRVYAFRPGGARVNNVITA